MNLVITDAGKQALVNATQTGTAQLTLSVIAVGSGQYTPDAGQTALQHEIKRLPIIQASAIEDHVIHVAYQDDSTDSYSAYEVGVFTSDGVLFAVYSSDQLLISKLANNSCLLAVDMTIDDLDVQDISFGGIEFAMGQATTENTGTVEIATQAEVDAGEDEYRVVTPATLAASFATRFASAFNDAMSTMTGVISTSDEREKHDIQAIPEAVLNAWEKVNFRQFEFRSADKIYFGVIAQDIIRAFESEGLNALEYGIVELRDIGADGKRYFVRYNECSILEAECVRRRLARIEAMLKGVENA